MWTRHIIYFSMCVCVYVCMGEFRNMHSRPVRNIRKENSLLKLPTWLKKMGGIDLNSLSIHHQYHCHQYHCHHAHLLLVMSTVQRTDFIFPTSPPVIHSVISCNWQTVITYCISIQCPYYTTALEGGSVCHVLASFILLFLVVKLLVASDLALLLAPALLPRYLPTTDDDSDLVFWI